jgi:hypothetical protein
MIDTWTCEHGVKHWNGEACDCPEPKPKDCPECKESLDSYGPDWCESHTDRQAAR